MSTVAGPCSLSISSSWTSDGYPRFNRKRKRSSCASGNGKVPSSSIGFWVAMTKNGSGSGWVASSTVTWRSCIASRRLDCARGVARLISSTSTMFAMSGPGRYSNRPARWSKIDTPVMSDGTMSGVHWTRRKSRSSERARARASVVFPTPGTSSSSTWPSTRSAAKSCSTGSFVPTTTRPTCATRRSAASLTWVPTVRWPATRGGMRRSHFRPGSHWPSRGRGRAR